MAPRPGSDWAFLLALIKIIFENGWIQKEACNRALGVEKIKDLAEYANLENLTSRCDLPIAAIRDVAERFALSPTGFCVARTGVSITENGSIGIWLAEILNLITGRIDCKGGKVFNQGVSDMPMRSSRTSPQTEVPSRVRGLMPVIECRSICELPDEINTPGPGQVRALFIHSGNPVVCGPDGKALDEALQKLDLLVAVDLVQRESHRHAHWLIPGEHFLERDEFMVALPGLQDQPFAQYSHKAVDLPGTVQPVWKFWADLALSLKVPVFGRPSAEVITENFHPEHMVKQMVNAGGRVTWEELINAPHGLIYGDKDYGKLQEHLLTPEKRIQCHTDVFEKLLRQRLAERIELPSKAFPIQLITRRLRGMMNSWLAETTGMIGTRCSGDMVDINTSDAASLGIAGGQDVVVRSEISSIRAIARVSNGVRPGVAIMEHGWGSRVFDPTGENPPEVHGVNRNLLVSNEDLDPLAGVPRLNGMPVSITPIAPGK